MKTELVEVSATRKDLTVEIPTVEVEKALQRIARRYQRDARVPGFRPGKIPSKVVRQRFRDHILQDVAQELVPRAVDEALLELGLEPVDKPTIRDLVIAEDQPLTFTAAFETVPPIDPGDYSAITLRRSTPTVDEAAVDEALERLRHRMARFEPVENRGAADGDTVVADVEHAPVDSADAPDVEKHENVSIEIGASANPPGFDEHLAGLMPNATARFTVAYPDDHTASELAGTRVDYTVHVQSIKRQVLSDLDDEFAKDMGDFDSLEALRTRVAEDLRSQAEQEAARRLQGDLLRQLAKRVTDVPEVMVEREVEHRLEGFVRQLIDQKIDPMKANIDWNAFRQQQQEPANEAVRSVLVLDEIARRENLVPTPDEIDGELERHAERTGRTASAVKAQLEKEGAITRVHTSLRREKAIDFLMAHATILAE